MFVAWTGSGVLGTTAYSRILPGESKNFVSLIRTTLMVELGQPISSTSTTKIMKCTKK